MLNNKVLIFPSLLSADFAQLGKEVESIQKAGADGLHVDVMDGHFVPNLSMGPDILKALCPLTTLPFDVHLMTDPVDLFIDPFIKAGATGITFHVEVSEHPLALLKKIKSLGVKAGLALKPGTPAKALGPFLEYLDTILVMMVDPGFGGQAFMESMLPKIEKIHHMVSKAKQRIHIAVDGGINPKTSALVKAKGASTLIAGSSIFGGNPLEYETRIRALREG